MFLSGCHVMRMGKFLFGAATTTLAWHQGSFALITK